MNEDNLKPALTIAVDEQRVTHSTTMTNNKGVKFDEEKERIDLVPPEAILGLAEVLAYGNKKYGAISPRNWETGMHWGRCFAALQRHLWKWWGGEELDPESGLPHIHHALANLSFFVTYRKRNCGIDDRAKTKTG